MKKALIVTRVSGFVPQFEMNDVRILQQMGYEVHYAANYDTIVYGTDNTRLDNTGIIRHHIPFCRSPFSRRVFQCYKQLEKLMEEEAFDLIHCHMPMTGIVTRMAAQKYRKKSGRNILVMYTTHGFHFYTGAPMKNWLYYVPERFFARYTDKLVTINEEDFKRAKSFKVRGTVEKISGVGIKLECDISKTTNTNVRSQVRQRLGFTEEDFLLISVGELTNRKNHLQVLRALTLCPDDSIKYVLCGSGPLKEELHQFVAEHSLEKRVYFTGYCTEVDKMLAASDCFVFPSLQEGLPMALMEAMAAGLPVIAKNIRGNNDLIPDGQGGMLLTKADDEDYAHAIIQMKAAPDREAMSQWNREQIQNFSLERVDSQMRRIYEEVSSIENNL